MTMTTLTVGQRMTPAPHTIGREQPLARAHEMMRKYGLRHLPVLEGGRLVGVVSQRDLYLVETLKDVDATTVTVEDAMAPDVYTAGADEPLANVLHEMAEHRYGSAVVVDGARVVGIFTASDAVRELAKRLGGMS